MIIQFSGVVVPVLVLMLSSGMNVYQVTVVWLASHTTAITIGYFSTRFLRKKTGRISDYLQKKLAEAESYVGSLGLFFGLILFNFSVWIYIAVPIMVLMNVDWKKIYLTTTIGNICYYLIMLSSIFWLYTLYSNILLTIVATLVIAFTISIIVYHSFRKINSKKIQVERAQK
ncbi:MAG: hypothetical protein KIH09_07525 [Candidatus Freyarchaeota archaeon]|nr:hypothetical protein [Candidatus Jordarchaeia archaeon]